MFNKDSLEENMYEDLTDETDDTDETQSYDEYHCSICGEQLRQIFESYEYQGFCGSREMWVCPLCE